MAPAADPIDPVREAIVADLERRIEILESLDDAETGSFTATDWVICTVGAVIIPALVMFWFAR